jgi:hypothetical protein
MKIERGKKALTGKGFRHNIEVMKNDDYSTKRAQGMAYGEAGDAKANLKAKKAKLAAQAAEHKRKADSAKERADHHKAQHKEVKAKLKACK